MIAHFCSETGVRIAAPGKCKSVDPENGHDEVVEIDGIVKPIAEIAKAKDHQGVKPAAADIRADKKGS